jgi:outer membrane protein assembly factor BamA
MAIVDFAASESEVYDASTRVDVLLGIGRFREVLEDLNIFDKIAIVIDEAPSDHPHGVDIVVTVEESSLRQGHINASITRDGESGGDWKNAQLEAHAELVNPIGYAERFTGNFEYAFNSSNSTKLGYSQVIRQGILSGFIREVELFNTTTNNELFSSFIESKRGVAAYLKSPSGTEPSYISFVSHP